VRRRPRVTRSALVWRPLRSLFAVPLLALACSASTTGESSDASATKGLDGSKDASLHDATRHDASLRDAAADLDALHPPRDSGTPSIDAAACKGVAIVPPISIAGRRFVDGHGCSFSLSGIDVQIQPGLDATATASEIASDGFNFVRLVQYWDDLEPTAPTVGDGGMIVHHWNAGHVDQVVGLASALVARGILVALQFHQGGNLGVPTWALPASVQDGGWGNGTAKCDFYQNAPGAGAPTLPPHEAMAEAWAYLLGAAAGTDAGDNGFIFAADLFNEPPIPIPCEGDILDGGRLVDDFFVRVGARLHELRPTTLLMIEDNAYTSYTCLYPGQHALSNDLPAELSEAGVALGHWAYSWHFYPYAWSQGQAAFGEHVARAATWGVPFWIGEFNPRAGVQCSDTNDEVPPSWQADPLSFELGNPDAGTLGAFQEAGVSWSLWVLNASGHPSNSLIWDAGDPSNILLRALEHAEANQ